MYVTSNRTKEWIKMAGCNNNLVAFTYKWLTNQRLWLYHCNTLSFRLRSMFYLLQVEQHRGTGRAEEEPVKFHAASAELPIGMCRNQISDSG